MSHESTESSLPLYAGTTISFSTKSNVWRSRYSFTPSCYMTVNNEMLSSNVIISGFTTTITNPITGGAIVNYSSSQLGISIYENPFSQLNTSIWPINGNSRAWKHDVNSVYNHFYNAPVAPSSVEVVSNDNPSSVKIFKSLSLESSTMGWEGEVYTNEDRGEQAQQQGFFLNFIEKEGVQYAEMPKDLLNSTGNIYLVGRVRLTEQLNPFDGNGNWGGNWGTEMHWDFDQETYTGGYTEGDPIPLETWDVPLWGPPLAGFPTAGYSGVFFGKTLLSVTEDGEIYSALPGLYPANPDSYGYKEGGIKLISYTNSHQPISHLTGDWRPPNSVRFKLGRSSLAAQEQILRDFTLELSKDVEAFDPWDTCEDAGFPPCTEGCLTDIENFTFESQKCYDAFFGYVPTEEDLENGYMEYYAPSGLYLSHVAVILDPNAAFEINRNGWIGVYALMDPLLNGDMMRGPYAGIKLTAPNPSEAIELFAINVDYEKTKLDGSLG